MISVVIPTLDSERLLGPTLAALVPGSTDGLLREVILADGGSSDGTATIAEEAGCEFLSGPVDEVARRKLAARAARGSWLLFVRPGAVLEEGWTREVRGFIDRSVHGRGARAATFRLAVEGAGLWPRLSEIAAATRFAFMRRTRDDQGLLIDKRVYHGNAEYPPRIVLLRTRMRLPA